MLPAEYSHPVIYVFTNHRKELSAYCIFLHLFVVALFGYILQSRLKTQVFLSGFCSPAKGSIGVLDCVMVRTVFFEERGVLLGEQVSVREAVTEHIEAGLHLFLGKTPSITIMYMSDFGIFFVHAPSSASPSNIVQRSRSSNTFLRTAI